MFPRLDQQHRFGANVANNVRSGLEVTTQELAAAEDVRGQLWHRFREFFERLRSPAHALHGGAAVSGRAELSRQRSPASRCKTYVDWIAPTFVLSLTGLPVASVPCGLDTGGMPVGLQIVGRQFGEESVLALARGVEMATAG